MRPHFDTGPFEPVLRPITIEEANALDLPSEVKNAINDASYSDQDAADWLRDVYLRNEDAILSLLLTTLTNLETLDLEVPAWPDYLERTLMRAGRRDRPFHKSGALAKLTQACWFHHDNMYGGKLAQGLFALPSLRSLFLHRIGSEANYIDFTPPSVLANLESNSSPIEHLELHNCRIKNNDVRDIFRVPRTLKTFIYSVGWGHLSEHGVSLPLLYEGLQQHRETLENLWLDTPDGDIEWLPDIDDTSPLGSFRDFTKLKRLRLAAVFIFDQNYVDFTDEEEDQLTNALVNLVPPNLETLHISHCEEYPYFLASALKRLRVHPDRPERLTPITLETTRVGLECHGEDLSVARYQSDKAGILVTILDNLDGTTYEGHPKVERKWGMDEDIEWGECGSECNQRPIYPKIDGRYRFEAFLC